MKEWVGCPLCGEKPVVVERQHDIASAWRCPSCKHRWSIEDPFPCTMCGKPCVIGEMTCDNLECMDKHDKLLGIKREMS